MSEDFEFAEVGSEEGDAWTAGAGLGNDLYLSPDDVEIPEDVPEPQLWRLLVMPIQPRKQSKGGIVLAESTREAEAHLNYIGKVVAVGPLAGKSEKFRDPDQRHSHGDLQTFYAGIMEGKYFDEISFDPPMENHSAYRVKVGDWVIYGRYAGQVCWFRDIKFLFINDDEVLGIAKSPDGFRIYT